MADEESGGLSGSGASLGLMAFWADIDADYLLRYQQWHNCEHIPERVSIPGFDRGRRYRAIDGRPHFLMFYETRTSAVLGSDAYLAALNSPTDWTRESLPHFRNPIRNIYELIGSAGGPGEFVSPYLTSVRFNLDDGGGAGTDGYRGPWLDALAAHPTVDRARMYQVDETISAIMTSERAIYGGGPGQQRYLALIESNVPFKGRSDVVAAAAATTFSGVDDGRRDVFEDRYWLEIGLEPRTRQR